MANINFITTQIATGGDLPDDGRSARPNLREWQRMGITHVIDNRLEWSDEDFVAKWAPEIHYLHNGIDDHGGDMPDEWFDNAYAFAESALTTPGSRVLAHCHMGINRGPSMAYALMLATGWDPVKAIAAIRSARPIAAVLYAEDALDWHHRRLDVAMTQRQADFDRLADWRDDNWIDVVRIIRSIRGAEAS